MAQRAGITERTVYRYFASERALRDAVMAELEAEAGVDLAELTLDAFPAVAAQVLEFVSTFPLGPRATTDDPTLASTNRRQHEALRAAVAAATDEWSDHDRTVAAAMLDVLWSMGTYERLVADWQLDPTDAITAVTWTIELVREAIAQGRGPTSSVPPVR